MRASHSWWNQISALEICSWIIRRSRFANYPVWLQPIWQQEGLQQSSTQHSHCNFLLWKRKTSLLINKRERFTLDTQSEMGTVVKTPVQNTSELKERRRREESMQELQSSGQTGESSAVRFLFLHEEHSLTLPLGMEHHVHKGRQQTHVLVGDFSVCLRDRLYHTQVK